jgi:hypothetical protein
MNSLKSHLLTATPGLLDSNCARTVLLMLEHNDGEAMSLNRLTEATISDLMRRIRRGFLAHPARCRFVSPGALKPATHGRFKTSHDCWWFWTLLLTLSGSTGCSKSQASTGFLFPPEVVTFGLTVWPLSRHPSLVPSGSDRLIASAFRAGGRFGRF